MITYLVLLAVVLLETQLKVTIECDQSQIIPGDILYLKTSFKNTSDAEYVVEVPTEKISYIWSVGYKSVRSESHFAGEAGTGQCTLAPGKSVSETALIAPWQEFNREAFDNTPEIRELAVKEGADPQIWLEAQSNIIVYRRRPNGTFEPRNRITNQFRSARFRLTLHGAIFVDDSNDRRIFYSLRETERNIQLPINYSDFKRTRDRMDRNSPVGALDFGLPLAWHYYQAAELAALTKVVNPQSRLVRLLKLIQLSNDWVQTPDGKVRVSKEQELLDLAATGGRIESEYLVGKTKKLIESKKREEGDFRPPARHPNQQ